MLSKIRLEILTISRAEKLFILCAMICGFCITSEYAITRPTSNSIFISAYGVKLFPYAWLATLPLNLLLVGLYNRCLPKFGAFKLQIFLTTLTIGMGILCAFQIQQSTYLPFLLNIWKDIYVLLMFQQLWSIIHSTIKTSRSKYLYGILFGFGGLGSIFGSFVPGFFAVKVGSPHLLLCAAPLYTLFLLAYYFLNRFAKSVPGSEISDAKGVIKTSGGLRLIKDSRLLKFILLIVVLMQLGATLIEFQFNSHLETFYPDRDLRTQFLGKIFGCVGMVNMGFQFIGSFLLVHLIGLRKSHLLIPTLLSGNALLTLLIPTFSLFTLGYGMVKSFEYSLFSIIKEMLYNPLKVEEKFKAKAIIDVLAFRSSKVVASLIVIALAGSNPTVLSFSILGIFFLWIITVYSLFKKEHQIIYQSV